MGSVSFSIPALAVPAEMPTTAAAFSELLDAPQTEGGFGSQFAILLEQTDGLEATVNPWHPQDEGESPDLSDRPLSFFFAAIPALPVPAPLDFSTISLAPPEEPSGPSSSALTFVEGERGVPDPGPSPKLPQDIEAFSGRLTETRDADPEIPQALENSGSPVREVTGPRPAITSNANEPHEEQSFQETPASEPEHLPLTASLPVFGQGEEAETAAAPQVAESRTIVADPEVPTVQAPGKGIQVRLGDDQATRVHLRVAERGGELHFDVRAVNPELAGALREGLPGLVKNLQSSGFRTEVWQPDNTLQAATQDSAGSREQSRDLPDRRRRREAADEPAKSPSRRWKAALFSVTPR